MLLNIFVENHDFSILWIESSKEQHLNTYFVTLFKKFLLSLLMDLMHPCIKLCWIKRLICQILLTPTFWIVVHVWKNVSFSSMYVRACVHLSSSCHSSNSTVGPLKVSMCRWKWKPRMHSQQQVLGESWNIQQDHRCPVSVFTEIQCTSYFQKRLYMQTVQMTLLLEKVCAFSSNTDLFLQSVFS